MDRIAQAASAEQAELFQSSAAVLKPTRSPAIVEKDFWVCWTLHRIYDVLKFRPELVFKGGTSLSKAYGSIKRFSEDVDLSLSRNDLGFTDSRDPEEEGISKNKSRRRIEALVAACQETIRNRLLPDLSKDFQSVLGPKNGSLELDLVDPQTIIFTYPSSELAKQLPQGIRPAVRLELGARSDDWPAEIRSIQPDAAEAFPDAFESVRSCRVQVLDACRTFWEKATLLHAEFHREKDKNPAEGLSRHYYDIYQLAQQEIGRKALDRKDLLDRVVVHKQLFFSSAWAHYESAKPGSFHVVPSEERTPSLRADYDRMQEMIFGEAPTWEEIESGLKAPEARINQL